MENATLTLSSPWKGEGVRWKQLDRLGRSSKFKVQKNRFQSSHFDIPPLAVDSRL
jgi:hypothetical protein